MEIKESGGDGAEQSDLIRLSMMGRSVRRARVGFICLGLVSALVAQGRCIAQDSRLHVRPREMATETKNPAAGEYPLDSVPTTLVSVPEQCVGARRCPLFIFLPGAGAKSKSITDWLRPVADKYGMILLAPSEDVTYKPKLMDVALQETLRRFAIDPDKIAIIGRCASGRAGLHYGIENLDVFNRIAVISGGVPDESVDPNNKTAEFLIDESFGSPEGDFEAARTLRNGGHPVKVVLAIRGHEHQAEDYDYLGHWLQESWSKPNPADRTQPVVVADPLPALTSEALTQLTAFWTSFSQEPDSIRVTARRAYLHEVIIPVGQERPSAWLTDMTALAAKYPSVAADLKKAGLTAQQHDAYRIALISARSMKVSGSEAGTVDPTSVLAKNLEFFSAHPDEFKTLKKAGISHPDEFLYPNAKELKQIMGLGPGVTYTGEFYVFMDPQYNPKQGDGIGPMGIWRTP